jgi:outer membrane protein TolC
MYAFCMTQARAVTLDDSIQQALHASPVVHAQESSADLAGGDRWRRFVFKEPQFSYTNADSMNQESWGVSLTTPFPGKSLAYTELDRVKSHSESDEVAGKKQDVAKMIADSYLDCASSQALLQIQKLAVHDLETLARSLSAMYESGHASQAERIGAELQVRQTEADLAGSRDKAETSCRKWRHAMGREETNLVPDGIPDDLAPATLAMLGTRPADETRGENAVNLALSAEHLRWWNQAPDLTWSYARNHYLYLPGSPTGKEWTTTVGVSLTIPIFFPFAESIEAQRARAQARIDKNTAEVQLLNARTDTENAVREFRRDRARIRELREKDIALAEALVQSTLAAYKIGKLGFAELMMSRKTLSDLRAQEVQLQVSAIQARLRCLNLCDGKSEGL